MSISINESYSGKLIAFMGLDGSGKTTHARLLQEYLKHNQSQRVHVIHGYSPRKNIKNIDNYVLDHGDEPLDILLPNLRSTALIIDLWENMTNKIIPWLKNGETVILDSYYYNSVAFAPLLGANKELISDLLSIFPAPDKTIYLRLTPEQSWKRIIERHKGTGERIKKKEQPIYLEDAFKVYERESNNDNVIVINSDEELEDISREISKYF